MRQSLSSGRRIFAVLGGGFFGTLLRYFLSLTIQSWLGKSWPADILIINLTGAFLLAMITTFADATFLVGPTQRIIINVGFLGAYTTFSSFALGDVLLIAQHHLASALTYLLLSLFGGVIAVLLGDTVGQSIVRMAQREIEPALVDKVVSNHQKLVDDGTVTPDHVDIDDDLLVPDIQEMHLVNGNDAPFYTEPLDHVDIDDDLLLPDTEARKK